MSKTECPSCGYIIEENQQFCPMCGTKINNVSKHSQKRPNEQLESMLFTINSNAEVALAKSLFWSTKNYEDLFKIESAYLELIQKFPTAAKAYCAYVEYAINLILKLDTLPVTSNFYLKEKQFNIILTRCKNYLTKAKEFADESELEQILQIESTLTSKVEALTMDDRLKNKQTKNKKITKWIWIGLAAFFVILGIVWIVAESLGI